MANYEMKFIVIPLKYSNRLTGLRKTWLLRILKYIEQMRIADGKTANAKYYVCNQDEPYAQKVIQTILDGEDAKG